MNDEVTYHRPVLRLGEGAASPELLFVGQAGDLPVHLRGTLHRHTHYELMLLLWGGASFFCDFQLYPLQAPALAFVAPGQLHAWSGDWAAFELIVASFTPALFAVYGQDSRWLEQLPFYGLRARPVLPIGAGDAALFETLFTTLLARFRSYGPAATRLQALYVSTLLGEAQLRYATEQAPASRSAAQRLTETLRQAVEQHYHERWQVRDYAELLGVTPNHLVKAVRQTTGSTPGELAAERLALEAKRQLAHTEESIALIAERLAFATPAQFIRWFKRSAGVPPGQFRTLFQARRTGERAPSNERSRSDDA